MTSNTSRTAPENPARKRLVQISKETLDVLPNILTSRPEIDAAGSDFLSFNDVSPLIASNSPGFPKIHIRVTNQDSFNAAIDIAALPSLTSASHKRPSLSSRPLVMNFASDKRPGGGWLTGAKAQEECLCYCSSLSLSLDKSHYPIPLHKFSYTKDVLIIRDADMKLLIPPMKAEDLPVVSCINIAALRRPSLRNEKYAEDKDRNWMRKKMRVTLRIAAQRGHSRLVLGAFGCGAFKNPVQEVAQLWKEVLGEPEFSDGWWEEIIFAVLWTEDSTPGKGNFEIFKTTLDGMTIGT